MQDFRIGHGYDAHRLVSGRHLVIGGVDIPHETGLLGHSDADVLVHAVMDALLGALALGDIGMIFPDSDERWRGVDSMKLASLVAELVRREGYRINNIDATVVAQQPKLAQYIPEMRRRLASVLSVELSCVSIKATTEEHMGFTGREEGICAHAVALVEKNETSA